MAKPETGAQANADGPVRVSVSLDAGDYADLKVIAKDKDSGGNNISMFG